VTFSKQVKTGGGPSAVDNIANYTLESPIGSSVSLAGKSIVFDGATKTARIGGLTLTNGNTFKVTVSNLVQDLAGNGMDTTSTPANNTAYGTVQNWWKLRSRNRNNQSSRTRNEPYSCDTNESCSWSYF